MCPTATRSGCTSSGWPRRGIISGYDGDGHDVNPCTGQVEQTGQLYYRPCNNVTRAQTSKIVANTFFPVNCAPGPSGVNPKP